MEDSFKKLLRKGTSSDRIQSYVFYGIWGVVIVGNLAFINGENYKYNLTFPLVISVIFGAYYWFFARYRFKPLKFWIDLFEKHPEDLVWVNPITTEHTAYMLVTYAKSYQFQLYLRDGGSIKIDCPESHKKIFYRMLREYAPHAHLGYSKEVKKVYKRHRKRFLQRLNEKGLLRTVNDYNL